MRFGAGIIGVMLAAMQGAAAQPFPAADTLNAQQIRGRDLFNQSCMVCHVKLQITSPAKYGPDLSQKALGGQEAVMREVISNGTPNMPGFKYHFAPDQIDAIVSYLKTLAGAPGPACPTALNPAPSKPIQQELEDRPMSLASSLRLSPPSGRAVSRIALALLAGTAFATAAAAELQILTGTITGPAGEKMDGVTVSAKAVGSTITTTVFTDEAGGYYFPKLPAGKYRVWAQALGFETAKGETELKPGAQQDFALAKITDTEKLIRQLPGDLILAGLPEDTADDARMKRIVHNNCTSCHTPSYILQHRFDEAGWHAIIQAMKNINVYGVYRPNAKNPVLDFHHDELARYLAKTRGPNGGAFKITSRPRPSGEAARAVFKEYDIPLNPDQQLPSAVPPNDGSDWTRATTSRAGSMPHDAAPDLDGNLWFAAVAPNKTLSVGRIDAKTGALKSFKIDAVNGNAANVHGLIRDAQRHDLVQCLDAEGRARQGRSQDRKGRDLHAAR